MTIRIVNEDRAMIDGEEALRRAHTFPAPPRKRMGLPAAVLVVAALMGVAFIAGRLSARGMADADVSIELGPEGRG